MTTSTVGTNVTCLPPVCGLDCNSGKCIVDDRGMASCKCPSLFEGDRCERYRCSGYCRNKGSCYADLLGKMEITVSIIALVHFLSCMQLLNLLL